METLVRKSRSQMVIETRAKLLKAARLAFQRDGFAHASLDDIAASAGLTRGAIYHHFGDKIGLFRAVVEEIDEEIDKKIGVATSAVTSQWQRFMSESHAYLECMKDPEIQQVLMRDGPAVLGDMASWPSHAKYHKMMVEALSAMMENHVIHACDPVALTRQINGALYSAAFGIARAKEPDLTFENSWQAFCLLMEGLRMVKGKNGMTTVPVVAAKKFA